MVRARTYRIDGKPGVAPAFGPTDKRQMQHMRRLIQNEMAMLEAGLPMTAKGVTAEVDRICEVRECLDTAHVHHT